MPSPALTSDLIQSYRQPRAFPSAGWPQIINDTPLGDAELKVIGDESTGLRSDSGADDRALFVHGGHRLFGTVRTSGFKHSLVTIVAAAAASAASVRVSNCPDIAETRVLTELLEALGGMAVGVGDTLTVNASGLRHAESAARPVAAVRSSST